MPITFHCQCGQRLSARDELAGRATKCPKCGAQLTIPAGKAAEPDRPAVHEDIPVRDEPPPVPKAAPLPPIQPAPQPPVRPAPQPQSPAACPGCGAAMTVGAVICVTCGYNVKLGRRMETATAPADPPEAAGLPLGITPVDVPAPTASKSERRAWIVAHTGLTVSLVSLMLGAFGVVLLSILALTGITAWDAPVRGALPEGESRFVLVVIVVGTLASVASFFSMGTGWMICCGVPERTGTRPLIRGAAGCPVVMAGLVILMFLMMAFLVPEPPSRSSSAKMPTSREEMERMQNEQLEKRDAFEEKAKNFSYIMNVLTWVEMLAFVGGYAMFGYFLGVLGDYLGEAHLRLISFALAGIDAAVAVWLTLSHFVITIESPGMAKTVLVLMILAAVANYGCLAYMSYRVRQAIQY